MISKILKKKIYERKLSMLNNNFDFNSSICMKIEKLYNDPKFKDIINNNKIYTVEKSKQIIYNFITTILFSVYNDTDIHFDKEILLFVVDYRLDELLFNNINIFKEELEFFNKYRILKKKIEII